MSEEQIELHPFYHDLRNEIVQPKDVIVESKYFWDKWKPRLGPTLTVIVMELRRRCYYNSKTGEKRDYCWPSLKFIADACGVSVDTIQRELKKPEAKLFIKVEARYNEKGRISNLYHVAMDDPLLPEDKDKLNNEITKKGGGGKKQKTAECGSPPPQNADHPHRNLRKEDVPCTEEVPEHEEVVVSKASKQISTTTPAPPTEEEKKLLAFAKENLPNYIQEANGISVRMVRFVREHFGLSLDKMRGLIVGMAEKYEKRGTDVPNYGLTFKNWAQMESLKGENENGGYKKGRNGKDRSGGYRGSIPPAENSEFKDEFVPSGQW